MFAYLCLKPDRFLAIQNCFIKKISKISLFIQIFTLFLAIGLFSFPPRAQAGFFADLFGIGSDEKEIEESEVVSDQNSQNLNLLQANVSSSSIVEDKNSKDSKIDESKEINILSENALLPTVSPLGALTDKDGDYTSEDISIYVVRKGDTVPTIAKLFGVTNNTILWANGLKAGEKLKEGDALIILPISGVKHIVVKGQTIKSIAKLYKVDPDDIFAFNNLDEDAKLAIGDEIIVPGAEIHVETIAPKKPSNTNQSSDNNKFSGGYYIRPLKCGIQTQGKHDKYAVDLACGKIGTPIYAAASGKVIFAKYGWNGAYGNPIVIAHPNGTQTFYAHQSKLAVGVGDEVIQGQVIGYVGNTGRSTGPHLHFEVRGAKNPGFDNSWAK